MGFGDLKQAAGLKTLNDFLAERSYIEGYTVSQSDVVVFKALAGAPGSEYCNALRWYNHVKSYSNDFSSLPGVGKNVTEYGPSSTPSPAPTAAAAAAAAADDDDDDDMDLFGDDDDDDDDCETFAEMQARKKAEIASQKKAKPAAKSTLVLDVKPWSDETDMADIEKAVRSIEMDGLLWGASKLVPVGYGIKKLQIGCVVVDDKVSIEDLEENITNFKDLVQSMDIAAFNKI